MRRVNESLGGIAPALTGRRTSLTVAALLLGVVFSDAGASVPLQRTVWLSRSVDDGKI
jgi:hypothetical protein